MNTKKNYITTSKLRVAYQGVPGAYGETAAMKSYPNCETIPCNQFEDAITAVETGRVEKAVIPIENSIGGSIHGNYDLLHRHTGVHVVGETHLVINHCLVALPGVTKDELNYVFSHPQALVQCKMSLNKLGVARIRADNTAAAAKVVASEGVRENGAIASARAAEIYGLDILEQNFQDKPDNITRFFKLAKKPHDNIIPTSDMRYKTSIIFTLEQGPDLLFKALAVFTTRGINLSKIESIPWEKYSTPTVVTSFNMSRSNMAVMFDNAYTICIDFEASMVETRAQCAVQQLKEFTRCLRVLGCYPMDN